MIEHYLLQNRQPDGSWSERLGVYASHEEAIAARTAIQEIERPIPVLRIKRRRLSADDQRAIREVAARTKNEEEETE